MAKRKHYITKTSEKARAEAFTNGRGKNQAYTSGARDAQSHTDEHGYNVSQEQGMKNAWNNNRVVRTVTSSKNGRMSVDGKTAGGMTHSFTKKDENGNVVKQSGRGKLATRRQRYYDVRIGLGMSGG